MAKQLQLSIPTPCHENWDAMTPADKGKFCGSCQKQVVDFSNMSDRAVAEFFKKPLSLSKGGSVCGRFMADQLDRSIEIPKKRIPWVKYFFQFAIPAFLISIKASAQRSPKKGVSTVAKDARKRPALVDNETLGIVLVPVNLKQFTEEKVAKQIQEPVESIKGDVKISADTIVAPAISPVCLREIMGKLVMPAPVDKNEIEGKVVDEKGEPVSFASIETGKPGQGLIADENGIFKIKKSLLTKGGGFIVSSTGFESRKVIAGEEEYVSEKLYVRLKANVVLPEVVITAGNYIVGKLMVCRYTDVKKEEKDTTNYRMGGAIAGYDIITTKDILTTNPVPQENGLFLYPNPVVSGSSVHLGFKNVDEGYYQLQILNQSGQMVHQKEIWIDAEARVLNIEVPSVPAGNYFLVLTNKKTGKKFREKIIIQ